MHNSATGYWEHQQASVSYLYFDSPSYVQKKKKKKKNPFAASVACFILFIFIIFFLLLCIS